MRDLIRNAMAMLRSGRLVALHLVGNAVLLTAAVLWLLIGEAHVTQLVFAVAAGLAILFLLLWLHSGTFAYSANPQPENFRAAFKPSFLRMLWLLLGSAILFWMMWQVSDWKDQEWQIGGYLYAKAPAALHPTRGVAVYYTWVDRAINFIFWYLTPGLLLPLIASRLLGAPILSWLKTLIQWRYWLSLAITTIVGVWCSELLLFWSPGKKLGAQTASLGLRVAAVYVLATAAWLATVGLLSYFVRRSSEKVSGKTAS